MVELFVWEDHAARPKGLEWLLKKPSPHCHSEVAAATEESLLPVNPKKERFLGEKRASE